MSRGHLNLHPNSTTLTDVTNSAAVSIRVTEAKWAGEEKEDSARVGIVVMLLTLVLISKRRGGGIWRVTCNP